MNNFKLDKEPKTQSGYIVPEDYFDQFSVRIMSKLPSQKPKVILIWSKNKRWVYGLAAILVLSLALPIANHFQDNSKTESDDIENYLAYHSTFANDEIVELLDENDISKLDINTTIDDKTMEELITENGGIENYITN